MDVDGVVFSSFVDGTEDMMSLDELGGVVWWHDVEASCICASVGALPFNALRLVNALPFFL